MELGVGDVVCALWNILAGLKGISEQCLACKSHSLILMHQCPRNHLFSLLFLFVFLVLLQLNCKILLAYWIKITMRTVQIT